MLSVPCRIMAAILMTIVICIFEADCQVAQESSMQPQSYLFGSSPQQPPKIQWATSFGDMSKIDEMQMNGPKLQQRICDLKETEARALNEKMHQCNQLNHVHQIEELLKPCRILKTTSENANSYMELERLDCQYEQCHVQVMSSPEYRRILQELEQMSPEERLNKDYQRFRCAMEALGLS